MVRERAMMACRLMKSGSLLLLREPSSSAPVAKTADEDGTTARLEV